MTTRREAMGLLAQIGLGAGATALLPGGALAQAASAGGDWRPLLNGRDLTGWTFFQDGVGAQDRDGVIAFHDGEMHVLGPEYTGPDNPGMGLSPRRRNMATIT